MVRKTKEEALETRNAILDAAEHLFQQHGVGQTSLAQIAAAAGVTRGAVYWHFANKADLFDAMMQRLVGPAEEALLALLDEHGDDALAAVHALLLRFFARAASDTRYLRVFEIAWHKCEYTGDMARIRDNHLECGANYLRIIEEAARRARAHGQIPPGISPRAAAVGLMALLDGLLVNWTLDPTRFDLAEVAPAVIDTFFAGLRHPPAGS